jgi:hypothetical protein
LRALYEATLVLFAVMLAICLAGVVVTLWGLA